MLGDLVIRAARRRPDAVAVRGPDENVTYGELDARANQVAHMLAAAGVVAGDRVAIWLPKSAETIVTMQGVLRLGAAYVPIEILSPPARVRTVILDCDVRAIVALPEAVPVARALAAPGTSVLAPQGRSSHLSTLPPSGIPSRRSTGPTDLAYILYTSGSTGHPKGVRISHLNATAFIEWAAGALGASESDRFSSHASFHFDLSVLDLYVAFSAGATVCLVPEAAAYAPNDLARFVREERITIWYSVPSAIALMMDHSDLLSGPSTSLRAVLFAGEPFPMKQLRRLREAWPGIAMWNLYGPTETNVCTAYEVPRTIDPAWTGIPIGWPVSGDRAWARTAEGAVAQVGEEGELLVTGPTVFAGYWGHPPRASEPYSTGDIVRVGPGGEFYFLGRRDHMVKIRGHRIELGEVEAALLQHASIAEAAALVLGDGLSARLVAFLGVGDRRAPSLLDVKRVCAERLPRYMIPDDAFSMPQLPRTHNGKIDRRALAARVTNH
jgi:amino acid adenylation domain-containing protein